MDKAQSSVLICRVEPFAALFCLSALYLPPPDPALYSLASLRRGTGSITCYGNDAGTAGWRVGSALKEAALLCPSCSYYSMVCSDGRTTLLQVTLLLSPSSGKFETWSFLGNLELQSKVLYLLRIF